MNVKTTGGYESTINVKVERSNRTLKDMVRAQLISRSHGEKSWCFWYQYSIWMVCRLINQFINTAPIILWLKGKHKIKFWEMIIWRCKVYVVNSKSVNKSLDPRTSKYPRKVVCPLSKDNINHQAYGYLMGYSNIKKVLLFNDTPHIWVTPIS